MRIKIPSCLAAMLAVTTLSTGPALACDDRCPPPIEGVELLAGIDATDRDLVRFEADYGRDLGADDLRRRADQLAEVAGWRPAGQEIGRLDDDRLALRDPRDPSASLELDRRSGSFLFNAGLAGYREEADTADLPQQTEARELVFRHLAKLELTPKDEELGNVHEGGLNMGVVLPDGSTKIYRKLVTLRIDRRLAGLPVVGESRIVAHLGEAGRLAGLVHQWPDAGRPRPLAPDELRGAPELQSEAAARLAEGSAGARRIVVTRADLVMYDDGRGIVEPAYHVEAELYYEVPNAAGDEQGTTRYDVPYDFFIPVTRRPRAFYPFMEVAAVPPTDGRRIRTKGAEDD